MLAHLKGKRRNFSDEGEEEDTEEGVDDGDTAPALATASRPHAMLHDDHTGVPADTSAMYADHEDTQMTCDVLVSLGNAAAHASPSGAATVDSTSDSSFTREKTNRGPRRAGGGGGLSSCPKSHQLPVSRLCRSLHVKFLLNLRSASILYYDILRALRPFQSTVGPRRFGGHHAWNASH